MDAAELQEWMKLAGALTVTSLSMLVNLAFVKGWLSTPDMDKRVAARVKERLDRVEVQTDARIAEVKDQTAQRVADIKEASDQRLSVSETHSENWRIQGRDALMIVRTMLEDENARSKPAA